MEGKLGDTTCRSPPIALLIPPSDGVLDQGVLTTSSPDQLDWAEDPHGRLLMGQFGQPKAYTRKIPQDLVIKTRTPLHRRIRLGLLLS